ncbi:MAG: winged helix-turn-helix domain-containing protein [Nocardioidaceae bacterium]
MAPLLRSRTQGELLAELYLHPGREYSLTDLARVISASVKTVHHEVERLHEAGLIESRKLGNTRLVSASTGHRLARPLTELLAASYGPVPLLTDALTGMAGVQAAFIYGSWAERHQGVTGPLPGDIDVLVVGTADLDDLDDIAREVGKDLSAEVNIQRVSPGRWADPDGDRFLVHVKTSPLVELRLDEVDA